MFDDDLTTLDTKMNVIEMITQFKVDHKVGYLSIQIDDSTEWNEDIIATIMEKYQNVHYIVIDDRTCSQSMFNCILNVFSCKETN